MASTTIVDQPPALPQPSSLIADVSYEFKSTQRGEKGDCLVTGKIPETHEAAASKALAIIASYSVHSERGSSSWDGLDDCLPNIIGQVKSSLPIRILLPGFPFKENSRAVCLGPLPDLGEELALAHLQGLCDNIATIYKHGAEVLICSDGLVYNDLMGISEEAVWEYGEALRSMATRMELRNIKFIRLWDLLDLPSRHFAQDKAKPYYLEHACHIRQELIRRYGDAKFNASAALATDKDWATTHAAYVGVLSQKSHTSPENTATQMIQRGKAYGTALRAVLPDYVRLSIHDSVGKDKISLALIPDPHKKGSVGLMPWRAAVAIEADGSYRTVYPNQVRETHDLVYRNGQPYFFRVKSDLFSWSDAGLEVNFEHPYPCGLIIRPLHGSHSMRLIPIHKVRHLSLHFSPIILRGFDESTNEDAWANDKGHEQGSASTWAVAGSILKTINVHEDSKTTSNGVPKFEDHEGFIAGEIQKAPHPPAYQYFTCLTTVPKGESSTLFCHSRLFFRYLPAPWSLERLEPVTWAMTDHEIRASAHKGLPLVARHPVTDAPCVRRWPSSWDGHETECSTDNIRIENEEQSVIDLVENMTRDFRTCLRLTWVKGDHLVNDNIAVFSRRVS